MIDYKKTFENFIQSQLNGEQQKAVQHKDGAILVIAGAGSGKTRVITSRIANLILTENVSPRAIVALTFTNKAAQEMKERIAHFLGSTQQLPFIGTFHSYCLQLLKRNPELLDVPFFSIIDEDDQQKLLQGIIQRHGLHKQVAPKTVSYQISHIKNHAHEPESLEALYAANPLLNAVFLSYEQEKKASRCLDFDDLMLEVLRLLKTKPEFKKELQETVRHILVDEYQDTNMVQHELLKHLSKDAKGIFISDSICVVGDEDQSIYSWRGATIANIINFKKDFPKSITIKIEQNYRSVQPILDVANQVIQNNKNRNPKKLWSDKQGVDRIRQLTCLSEYQEGDVIANLAQSVQKTQKLSSIAVLYRTHFQSRAIEEALVRNSIPYRIIGGVQFYERKEIKDLLAYLKLIVNPFDRSSFFRVINTPNKGLGLKFEELFQNYWQNETFLNFHDVSRKLIEEMQVAGGKKVALEQFLGVFKDIPSTQKPSIALEQIIAEINYIPFIKESYETEEAQERIENIKELLNALKHFEANNVTSISQFLDEVALMQEAIKKKSDSHDAILLMTLHAAKGLEFDTVILAGLEEGLLPSTRSMVSEDAIEEERRLFYVGITRARERLLLSHCRYRYGYKNMTDQLPSRFLQETPKANIKHDDCSYWKSPEMKIYFSSWFGTRVAGERSEVMTFGSTNVAKKEIQQKIAELTKKKELAQVRSRPAPAPASTFKPSSSLLNTGFRSNQSVSHEKFGIGTVQSVEVKGNGDIFVTVKFRTGAKKMDSKFLKTL
jgi:DNA helicase-2/ATP-dependent DNA helicase PcrA